MQRQSSQSLARRTRIGVLLDSVETLYQRDIVRGLVEAAENAGASLWCFLGGYLPASGQTTDVRHRIYVCLGPGSRRRSWCFIARVRLTPRKSSRDTIVGRVFGSARPRPSIVGSSCRATTMSPRLADAIS